MDLIISKMEDKDFETLHTWYKDPAYAPFFRHTPDNLTPEQLQAVFTVVGVVIRIDTPDTPMAALVSVSANPKTQIADMGVMVRKDLRKEGIAKATVLKMVDYLFNEGTIQRVVMYATEPETIASLKRGGMFEECRMYRNAYYNGKIHNESRLVITKDFYKKTYSKGA